MSTPRILFGQPMFGPEEADLVLQTLRSGWIGQGPLVERFERHLEAYLGAARVVTVSSCTAALHLALSAAGVGPGDEVVTTAFTFVATLNAIEHTGARAVVVDIDPATLNIDAEACSAALTPRTRALLPVHFGGRPARTADLYRLAEEHDLWVIEDAAHAVGAVVDGHRVGGSGHPRALTCFSFYPNKNLASAEGGAIALADADLAAALRSSRLHGLDVDAWDRYRTHAYRPSLAVRDGWKYNWTDLQAAIALPQLEKLEGFLAVREHLAQQYDRLLAGVRDVRVVDRGDWSLDVRHALHLYQVEVRGDPGRRDAVADSLRSRGVGAAVHYIAAHRHPWFAARIAGSLPVSDWASDHLLTLPLHPHLGADDVEFVVRELERALVHAG